MLNDKQNILLSYTLVIYSTIKTVFYGGNPGVWPRVVATRRGGGAGWVYHPVRPGPGTLGVLAAPSKAVRQAN